MAIFKNLPRSCKIERKEYVLSLDIVSRKLQYWLSEVGAHKAFSVEVTPDAVDWLINTFKTLIATPSSNRFFLEVIRFSDYVLWVIKVLNKNGCIAEVFRVDRKGKKLAF